MNELTACTIANVAITASITTVSVLTAKATKNGKWALLMLLLPWCLLTTSHTKISEPAHVDISKAAEEAVKEVAK